MKNKSLSLAVGLLAFAFCPSFSHAGLIPFSIEVGALGGYVLEVPTEVDLDTPPADFSFEIDGAAFLSAYGFLGFDVFDPPAVTATLEAMVIYNLKTKNFSDLDFVGFLDDPSVDTDFAFEGAYGGGARLSFGLLGFEVYARGGYAHFSFDVENGRVIDPPEDVMSNAQFITEKLSSSEWGPYLGAGIKLGLFTLGYYHVPKLENAHIVSMGIQFF